MSPMQDVLEVGTQTRSGGRIFFIAEYPYRHFPTGYKYYEVAPPGWYDTEEDPALPWCPERVFDFELTMEEHRRFPYPFGIGKVNTSHMMSPNFNTSGDPDHAATVCRGYRGGGHTDWFLPSVGELLILAKVVDDYPELFPGFVQGIRAREGACYWSSSQHTSSWAQTVNFRDLYPGAAFKREPQHVRPIRCFGQSG